LDLGKKEVRAATNPVDTHGTEEGVGGRESDEDGKGPIFRRKSIPWGGVNWSQNRE